MPPIRSAVCWLVLLVGLAAPAQSENAPEAAEPMARTWHGPATLAAEAAKAKASDAPSAAIAPPAPKPAARPAAVKEPDPKGKAAAVPAAKATKATVTKAAKGKGAHEAKSAASQQPTKPGPTAKQLFGTVKSPAPLTARAVGFYSRGCLAGGKPLAVDGPGWQVMRLSRNRNWGHPKLVALLERLARETTAAKEWPGLLVGDMSQPRGGPMISGHASHQVGLDVDIWLTPMPDRKLTRREREDTSAVSMLRNAGEVNPKVWGEGQVKLIKRAASYDAVERILVHPALKKALCEAAGTDRTWLRKVRPYFGHFYHFHLRIGCPNGSVNCRAQAPVPESDGCDKELEDWLKRVAPKPKKPPVAADQKPTPPAKPAPPKPEITLADLPVDCQTVLTAGGNTPPTIPAKIVDRSKDAGPERDTTASTAAPEPPPAEKKTAQPVTTN